MQMLSATIIRQLQKPCRHAGRAISFGQKPFDETPSSTLRQGSRIARLKRLDDWSCVPTKSSRVVRVSTNRTIQQYKLHHSARRFQNLRHIVSDAAAK